MSAFAHRHYEAIAEIIGDVDYSVSKGEVTDAQAYEVMVRALELLFIEDNPKFNLERFHNACGKVGK
jgi:hypothetical protein